MNIYRQNLSYNRANGVLLATMCIETTGVNSQIDIKTFFFI